MATILKQKNTGDYVFHTALFGTVVDTCEYMVCCFDGVQFVERERDKISQKDYACFMGGYEWIQAAPPMPIVGDGFDADFWREFFQKLKNP